MTRTIGAGAGAGRGAMAADLPGAMAADLLAERAAMTPQRPACTLIGPDSTPGHSFTFHELHAAACGLAARLPAAVDGSPARPPAAGAARALLALPPGPAFVSALFGCWYAGVVPVLGKAPEDGRDITRLAMQVIDASPDLVLCDERHEQAVTGVLADMPKSVAALTWAPAVPDAAAVLAGRPPGEAILHSAGTTGAPRAVSLAPDRLLSAADALVRCVGLGGDDVVVGWLSPDRAVGLTHTVLAPLLAGCHCVVLPSTLVVREPLRWLAAITRYGATVSAATDTGYRACLAALAQTPDVELDLGAWRAAGCTGERVRPDTLDAFAAGFGRYGFRRTSFHIAYGSVESAGFTTGTRPGSISGPVRGLLGCGGIGPARVRDTDGEILLSAPAPEGTGTQDRGFVVDDELYVVGPARDVVAGPDGDVHLLDLEATVRGALVEHDRRAVVAFPAGGAIGGVVVAYETGAAGPSESLVDDVRDAVERTHATEVVAVVAARPGALPRGRHGEVERASCRARYVVGTLPGWWVWSVLTGLGSSAYVDPAAVEDWLIDQVAQLVGGEPDLIDPDLPLADQGLRSLAAVRLAAWLSYCLGIRLNAMAVYDHPTVGDLAACLVERAQEVADE